MVEVVGVEIANTVLMVVAGMAAQAVEVADLGSLVESQAEAGMG